MQKLSLRKSQFTRDKTRQNLNGNYFSNADAWFKWLTRILLTFVFAPIIATASLFAYDFLLIAANITLALGYLGNYFLKIRTGNTSIMEVVSVAWLLAGAIVLGLWGTANLIPIASSAFVAGILYANIIATSINAFFTLKSVIVPIFLKSCHSVISYFGCNIDIETYKFLPFRQSEDGILLRLTGENYFGLDRKKFAGDATIQQLNACGNLLTFYLNKYSGPVSNESIINRLDAARSRFATEGNPDQAYGFITMKLFYKRAKMYRLQTIQAEIKACQQNRTQREGNYKKLLARFTTFHTKSPALPDDDTVNRVFDNEIARQQHKIEQLTACLPRERRDTSADPGVFVVKKNTRAC